MTRRYVRGTIDERFNAYLEPGPTMPGMDTPCIEWSASKNARGYGLLGLPNGGSTLAHRYALERVAGPDPRAVLHACDNPPCCNPEHLRYGTRAENNQEMAVRGRAARGENRPQALLTEQHVLEARRRVLAGEQVTAVAKDMPGSAHAVFEAVRGFTWAHLPGAVGPIRQLRRKVR